MNCNNSNRTVIPTFVGMTGIIASFFLVGCGGAPKANLQYIYNRAAQHSELERNPVILIPGTLGSRLVDKETGKVVWGAFGGKSVNPNKPDGARLLALPMKKGVPLSELRDSVEAVGVLDRVDVRLWGIPFELRTYFNVISVLGSGGYRDEEMAYSGGVDYGEEHFTCFQFPYDFRRDVVESAKELDKFIKEKKKYVESEIYKRFGVKKKVKFDLVSHSHGGNVTRYYLRYGNADPVEPGKKPRVTWKGAKYVDKAFFVGPPTSGAVKAFREVIKGRKIGPTLPTVEPAVAGTHPSNYQLFPRGRHKPVVDAANHDSHFEDLMNPELWIQMKWGLASPDQEELLSWLLPDVKSAQERKNIALDHLRKSLKRGKQVMEALDYPAKPPKGLKLILIAGDAEQTEAKISVNRQTGKFKVIGREPGDITVTRASALGDERVGGKWVPKLVSPVHWTRVIFIFNDHVGLTKDPVFADNLLYELLESQ